MQRFSHKAFSVLEKKIFKGFPHTNAYGSKLINKGIEFIDLPSIFRDNNVISAIPSYFENTESPILCYRYYKPIRNTILNFNKLVSDLDIETSSPDS